MLRVLCFAFTACVTVSSLNAARDIFCGKWKINDQRSKFAGVQVKVQELSGNRFTFTTEDGMTDTVTADGSDHPVAHGGTMSLAKEGPNNLRMILKHDGKIVSSMIHSLSPDGNTQTIAGQRMTPSGTSSAFKVIARRIGGGVGWTGTWESTDVHFGGSAELNILPFATDGLTFQIPSSEESLSMKFDGKEYALVGPFVAPNTTSSGKRINAHTIEITEKENGRELTRTRYEVSPDGKTLAATRHLTGQPKTQLIIWDKLHGSF